MKSIKQHSILLALLFVLGACGGGDGSNDPAPTSQTASASGTTDFGDTAYWPLDTATNSVSKNTKFDALHANLVATSFVPGKYGQALQFDPAQTAGSYARIPVLYACGLGCELVVDFPSNQIALQMWVYPDKIESLKTYQLLGGGTYGEQSFKLRIEDGKLKFYANARKPGPGGTGGDSYLLITSQASLVPGSWQHIAVSFDGTSAKTYVNGSLDNTSNLTLQLARVINDLYLGGLSSSEGGYTFPGKIDEVWFSASIPKVFPTLTAAP